jgi:hypothetical protein
MTRLPLTAEHIQISTREERPATFDWRGETHYIQEINRRWRIDAGWWDPGIRTCREYWEVVTDTGLLCVIHHDLPEGEWYLSRLYD